jgi:hypothetical protein
VQQFQSPAGNSLVSADRRIPKRFQQFAGDSLLFAEQGIVSSEQGIGNSEPRAVGFRGDFRAALTPFVFSREFVLPKLHPPAATRQLSPGWCAQMVGAQISWFDRFGIFCIRSYALRHVAQDDRKSCGARDA